MQQRASVSFLRDADVNPTDEFRHLISLFPEGDELFGGADYIPAVLTPEPYKRLLVHDRHMTVAMEELHRAPVVVKVLDRKLEGNIYSRKIPLKRSHDGSVVQVAVMRFLGSFSASQLSFLTRVQRRNCSSV